MILDPILNEIVFYVVCESKYHELLTILSLPRRFPCILDRYSLWTGDLSYLYWYPFISI